LDGNCQKSNYYNLNIKKSLFPSNKPTFNLTDYFGQIPPQSHPSGTFLHHGPKVPMLPRFIVGGEGLRANYLIHESTGGLVRSNHYNLKFEGQLIV